MNNKNEKTPDSQLLECVCIEPAQPAKSTVIWLHGLGADGHDFEPIVPHIALPPSAAVRFIFPHAPVRPVTINNGYAMRAWYDITTPDIGDPRRADAETIRISIDQLRALISAEVEKGIPAERIVLAGFSQGGVIALQAALQYEQTLGGVMVLSSYIAMPDELAETLHSNNKNIRVFLAHGLHDAVLPYVLAEQSKSLLAQWHYDVTYHHYPMEHNVCPEEIVHIGEWLSSLSAIK